MSKHRVVTYRSDTATVTWDQDLCIHIGECGRAKNELFVAGRDPWCDPATVDDDTVREVVARCPTGALHATFEGASADRSPPTRNTITVAYDGPLFFAGDLEIEGAPSERAPALDHRAALCRCGLSKHKPYCDNSHHDGEWRDHGAVGETGTTRAGGAGDDNADGPLVITVAKDGPLRVEGNMTVIAGTGREAWHGSKTALCRCGLSKNRPFCDGSHRKEGWSDGS